MAAAQWILLLFHRARAFQCWCACAHDWRYTPHARWKNTMDAISESSGTALAGTGCAECGASVVFVSGHQVGLETRDDHAFITPIDRPFIVDESLRRQGAQIRAGSCAGARPVSALHPCGTPVQNPWSRPCCDGDGLSLYGAGVQAASHSHNSLYHSQNSHGRQIRI